MRVDGGREFVSEARERVGWVGKRSGFEGFSDEGAGAPEEYETRIDIKG